MLTTQRDRLQAGLQRHRLFLSLVTLGTLSVLGVGLIGTAGANAEVAPASTALPPTSSSASSTGPSAPTNITAVAHANSITLSWTASTPGCCPVTGYKIGYFRAFDDNGVTVDVGAVTTATLPLSPATQYNFSVIAVDSAGHWSTSATISVMTLASDSSADQAVPSAPTGLTATNVTGSSADLTWAASTDNVGVTGYNVYAFDGVFISTLVATTTATSATVPVVPSQQGHDTFYVRARDAAGNLSLASNTVTVPAPTGSPTKSPTAGPSPTLSPATLSCKVTFANSSVWHGGFVANITISNTGTAAITGWDVTFTFGGDQRISSGWNLTFSQTGAAVTLHNAAWNTTIGAGRAAVAIRPPGGPHRQPGGCCFRGGKGRWRPVGRDPGGSFRVIERYRCVALTPVDVVVIVVGCRTCIGTGCAPASGVTA
jgi:hypothetical protein